MGIKPKNTMLITSLLLLLVGIAFLLLENTFYQYIDEDGILRESFFMPLGFLSIILGFTLLLVMTIRKLISRKK